MSSTPWHNSRNKVKHSWKISCTFAGNRSQGRPFTKTNSLTTEPKSWISDAVVRDWLYTRSYAKSTLCRYIGESAWPITLNHLQRSHHLWWQKVWLSETKVQSRTSPHLQHNSRNKVKHSCKISPAFAGNRSRVAPVQNQCSYHWAKESTLWHSCQRLIIYKKLCKIYLM